MKKILDKVLKFITCNKNYIIFFISLLIVGVILGSLFAVFISKSDKTLVLESLNTFFSSIKNNNINYIDTLKNTFFVNAITIFIIWLLGISVIGLPIMIFIYFSKCFAIGFTLASIIANFKLKGTLISFFYLFPHSILNIIIYIILLIFSVSLSIKIISALTHKKTIDFKVITTKYKYVLLFSLICVCISSLIEVFLMPNVLKFII